MLQAVYEAVDSAEASARLFLTDFTKGFDLIDHITDARAARAVHPVLLKWIAPGLPDQPVASS